MDEESAIFAPNNPRSDSRLRAVAQWRGMRKCPAKKNFIAANKYIRVSGDLNFKDEIFNELATSSVDCEIYIYYIYFLCSGGQMELIKLDSKFLYYFGKNHAKCQAINQRRLANRDHAQFGR